MAEAKLDQKKVKVQVLKKWLKEFGLELSGTKSELVERMSKHQAAAKEQADCDNCGAISDVNLPECPFCGVAGMTEEEGDPGEDDGGDPEEEAPVEEPATEIVEVGTEADLDIAVAKVRERQRDAVVSYWRIGQELMVIFEKRLYTTRATEDGTPLYKNWGQFTQAELGMSGTSAYKLLEVAVMFDEETIREFGVTKLGLIAKLDESERQRLLESGAAKQPVSELQKEVAAKLKARGGRATPTTSQRVGQGRGFRGGSAAAKKGSEASAKARADKAKKSAKAKPANQVTVAQILGRTTIKLFASKLGRPKKGQEPSRAKSIESGPVGTEQLVNGVVVVYRVVRQATGLALVVERKREDSK